MKTKRILILGGTTHANRGDLAMQAGLIQWLQREVPGAEIRMLASNPDLTRQVLGVPAFPSPDSWLATPWTRETPTSTSQRKRAIRKGRRFAIQTRLARWIPVAVHPSAREFASHLRWADAVFVPGSGSMNSLWWHDWLYPKAFTVLAAAVLRKPVFMTSQGVGPAFSHALDAAVAGRMFRACRAVGVRDGEASGAILRSVGVDAGSILLTGDDALLFTSDAQALSRPHGKLVGVNLRDSSGYGKRYPKPELEACATALRRVLQRDAAVKLVFIPISYDSHDDDRKSAAAVASLIGLPERITLITEELDAAQLRGTIAGMDVCLGVSYHFLLFALSSGVPCLGFWQNPYYQQKLGGLFRLFEWEDQALDFSAGISENSQELLADRLASLLENRNRHHRMLAQRQSVIDSECRAARNQILHRLA
ncbi:MAG: polysaccharide pyruvyl transferase family protein [Verrucomicrobiales bacterium]|nr:polysaccharide pyruvyl transferase family protein [Verrucomicrobiales bacterium]